jgi:hypothetical protein
MALLALGGVFVLVMALVITFICLGAGSQAGRAAPSAMPRFGAQAGTANKQQANTPVSALGVHQVVSPAGCWPGVWVGPSPAPQATQGEGASPGQVPTQRCRPSGIAARATSHGALR